MLNCLKHGIRLFVCGFVSLGLTASLNASEQNLKTIAVQAQDAFFKDYSEDAVRRHFRADYIQHNPHVPTGIDPVIGFLPLLKQANTTYTTHRLLQDGEYIVFHNTYRNAEAFGAPEVVTFDLWRMQDGMVAEHWDAIQPFKKVNPSGRTQVDGWTEITDLHKTQQNKALVEAFYRDVFVNKKLSSVDQYVSQETYFQHNSNVADGIVALKAFLSEYIDTDYQPATIHRVLGEGNFVLVHSEAFSGSESYAVFDLFRVAGDKIVEHWDVIQQVPEKMAHENGMF